MLDGGHAPSSTRHVRRARLAPQARFALHFVLLAGTMLLAYCFPYRENGWSERWFEAYLSVYARVAGVFIALWDPQAQVLGRVISGGFAVEIAKNCDAMEAKILFVAAVLAFPAPWPKRALAAAVGVLLLAVANLLRILGLYFIGLHHPKAFELAHIELFPLLLILIAVVELVLWTNWLQKSKTARLA